MSIKAVKYRNVKKLRRLEPDSWREEDRAELQTIDLQQYWLHYGKFPLLWFSDFQWKSAIFIFFFKFHLLATMRHHSAPFIHDCIQISTTFGNLPETKIMSSYQS